MNEYKVEYEYIVNGIHAVRLSHELSMKEAYGGKLFIGGKETKFIPTSTRSVITVYTNESLEGKMLLFRE